MRIGEVARRADVTVKTVRHYESLGLIGSSRLANGYRDYDDDSPVLVAEAHALSRAGIPLENTRPFLDCLTAGREHADDCMATRPAYRAAIADLTSRIDDLQRRRSALRALLASAEDRESARCSPSPGRHETGGSSEPAMRARIGDTADDAKTTTAGGAR